MRNNLARFAVVPTRLGCGSNGPRFTPKSVTWPRGFDGPITGENGRSTDPCHPCFAERYLHGVGWSGVGFPHAMIFQFVDNS